MRPSSLRDRLFVLAIATAATLTSILSQSTASDAAGLSLVRPGTVLTNTALGGFSELGQIDMLTPTLGYALAVHPGPKGTYVYYQVRTTDLAKTWTVVGKLPISPQDYPTFTGFTSMASSPFIYFVSRDVGYVGGPNGFVYVTDDAGTTWARVMTPGSSPTYGVNGSTMSVVSGHCSQSVGASTATCQNLLSEYRVGSTHPESSVTVPVTSRSAGMVTLLAVAPNSTQVVNVNTDNGSTPTSLLITRDNGRQWGRLSNPCSGLPIDQLVVGAHSQWLLACFRDEGMSQGPARLFRSTNEGASWSTDINTSRGTTLSYELSGDGRTIYGLVSNPAGGLIHSTDGGRHWTSDLTLGYDGGAPESISNFGPTSAIYQILQGPVYVTRDSSTWRILPQLPAGKYRGLNICTTTSVDVSLRRSKYGGLWYTYVDFANKGGAACYLNGVPTLQPLNLHGASVGPPIAVEPGNSDGDFIVLKAHSGIANIALLINTPPHSATSRLCDSVEASALRINFGAPSSFRLSLRTKQISTCTRSESLYLGQINPGIGKP